MKKILVMLPLVLQHKDTKTINIIQMETNVPEAHSGNRYVIIDSTDVTVKTSDIQKTQDSARANVKTIIKIE